MGFGSRQLENSDGETRDTSNAVHMQMNITTPISVNRVTHASSPFAADSIPEKRRPRRNRCNCTGGNSCPARMRLDMALIPLKESKRNLKWRLARKVRSPGLRGRLLNAFGMRCQYCGEYGSSEGVRLDRHTLYRWTIDRIDPHGTYDPDNVTLACNSCNGRKGNRIPDFPVVSLAIMEAS